MNHKRLSRLLVIGALTVLLTISGCSVFNQVPENGRTLPTQSNPASLPDTGSISGQASSTPTQPTQQVVIPAMQITAAPVISATPQASKAMVAADNLNLRIGPGLNYAVVRLLQQGFTVIPTGRSIDGLWIEVHTLDGSGGWVFRDYLQTSIDLAALPVAEAHGGLDSPAPTPNSSYRILVSIDNNVAKVTVARFPPNRKITATLGPAGKAPGLLVAKGITDTSGKTTMSFEMPANWEDGSRVTENNLVLVVSTNDSSFNQQVSVVYIH